MAVNFMISSSHKHPRWQTKISRVKLGISIFFRLLTTQEPPKHSVLTASFYFYSHKGFLMHSPKVGYHMFVPLSQVVTTSPSMLLPVLQMKAILHCVELHFAISMVRPFAPSVSVNASDLLQDALRKKNYCE